MEAVSAGWRTILTCKNCKRDGGAVRIDLQDRLSWKDRSVWSWTEQPTEGRVWRVHETCAEQPAEDRGWTVSETKGVQRAASDMLLSDPWLILGWNRNSSAESNKAWQFSAAREERGVVQAVEKETESGDRNSGGGGKPKERIHNVSVFLRIGSLKSCSRKNDLKQNPSVCYPRR